MELILAIVLLFAFVVFPATAMLFAIRNWLSGPPSIRGMIRHIQRQEQRDLDALKEAKLEKEEHELARQAGLLFEN